MTQKKLERGSVWEKADSNGDGIVSDQELQMRERMIRLEIKIRKKINKDIWFGFLQYQ